MIARVVLVAVLATFGCEEAPLPQLAQVPAFALTDQHGQPFGSAQLEGKVWVASFIFTTCPSICPTLTTQMGNIARRFAEKPVTFVSFTVDPENDTPEVLRRYAEERDAHWTFLTGETAAVRRAVSEGLRVAMGERTADGDILHATHFVLVDAAGHIRGYYRQDREAQDALERDIGRLLDP